MDRKEKEEGKEGQTEGMVGHKEKEQGEEGERKGDSPLINQPSKGPFPTSIRLPAQKRSFTGLTLILMPIQGPPTSWHINLYIVSVSGAPEGGFRGGEEGVMSELPHAPLPLVLRARGV